MRILIIGGGAREHALGWKLKQSSKKPQLYFAPGNAGTSKIGTNIPIEATNIAGLMRYAVMKHIDLTVIGPEDPLNDGIVDSFEEGGLRIFGPRKAAAQLEASKAFAKEIMTAGNVPTAKHATFSDHKEALQYIHRPNVVPCFIKADGLAAGKGAKPCINITQARQALEALMLHGECGEAGKKVVIEDYLDGQEISVHAVCDKTGVRIFPISRDHKRALDGDEGENTGGMGTVAPVPMPLDFLLSLRDGLFDQTLKELAKSKGVVYRGALFPGLMMTRDGPKVLEFNCRFGDPETEVYMKLLESDLIELLEASIDDRLADIDVTWRGGSAACVVMASGGYPGAYKRGLPITGIRDAEASGGDVTVFHAGTTYEDSVLVTNGGRVLAVTTYAQTMRQAIDDAYRAVSCIEFEGMRFRLDIGQSLL